MEKLHQRGGVTRTRSEDDRHHEGIHDKSLRRVWKQVLEGHQANDGTCKLEPYDGDLTPLIREGDDVIVPVVVPTDAGIMRTLNRC